jgi:hypothetical protein
MSSITGKPNPDITLAHLKGSPQLQGGIDVTIEVIDPSPLGSLLL